MFHILRIVRSAQYKTMELTLITAPKEEDWNRISSHNLKIIMVLEFKACL